MPRIRGRADSRLSSELAFDPGPGALFVVRVVGNFATDEGLGRLACGAVAHGTELILALGVIALQQPAQGGVEPR